MVFRIGYVNQGVVNRMKEISLGKFVRYDRSVSCYKNGILLIMMDPNYRRPKIILLVSISLISIGAILFIDPISQDLQYHQFADQRRFWFIPHSWNVLSNLLFALVGFLGLHGLCVRNSLLIVDSAFAAYMVFFIALIAIAPGSAWYHWLPNNTSLVWDRLPMTLAFMSFF